MTEDGAECNGIGLTHCEAHLLTVRRCQASFKLAAAIRTHPRQGRSKKREDKWCGSSEAAGGRQLSRSAHVSSCIHFLHSLQCNTATQHGIPRHAWCRDDNGIITTFAGLLYRTIMRGASHGDDEHSSSVELLLRASLCSMSDSLWCTEWCNVKTQLRTSAPCRHK